MSVHPHDLIPNPLSEPRHSLATMGLFCNHLERKRIVTKTRGTRRLNRMPHFVCVGRCHNAVNRCNGFRIGTETRLCHFGEWKLLELFLRMFLRYTGTLRLVQPSGTSWWPLLYIPLYQNFNFLFDEFSHIIMRKNVLWRLNSNRILCRKNRR